MSFILEKLPLPFLSADFEVHVLKVESKSLKNNALGDSAIRYNYVLKAKTNGRHPVVFHLSGYFGNGPQTFNLKTMEDHFPELIAQATAARRLPLAHHVFVDAMTSVGGSQFINSKGCGQYADYLQNDLYTAVTQTLPTLESESSFALLGSSSGGYGALAHITNKNSPFGVAMAVAPDSAFELSLLQDYYKVSDILKDIPTVKALRHKLADARFKDSKNLFPVMNSIAMALCYSEGSSQRIHYPIDLYSGVINEKEFKTWKSKDPAEFLKKASLKKKDIYLSVGRSDEFNLQFGARQIHAVLKKRKIKHHYSEFEGGHFKSTKRKIEALEWLKTKWT